MAKKSYVCWVRVIPASLAGSGYELEDGSIPKFIIEPFNGPKRPKRTAVDGSAAWFDADEVHYGNPRSDVVFDFGPAFGDRKKAAEWLERKGQQWAKEARNFFLLAFDDEQS